MALQKYVPSGTLASVSMRPSSKVVDDAQPLDLETRRSIPPDVDIDIREVYFLIMHFLSTGPCKRTYGVIWNELLEHQLLPRRYHAWYSRRGMPSGDEHDDGLSFPLNYTQLLERNPDIEKDHLVKLLKQLILNAASPSNAMSSRYSPNAADVPTLLGMGSFSLLSYDGEKGEKSTKHMHAHMRWPHVRADQVRGLTLREIGGGFARHHRAPSIRAACYAIAKPSTVVQRMHNIKRVRGHRNAVYCAIFDRSGRYVITGSDDRLVKIWSMETAYCLASCRGHEGDITDLAVSSNNTMVASSSNDCVIRVWRLPDGLPVSVLRGHTAAVTAITFSPRPGSIYQLLSSSDDGTCRLWDARNSQFSPRIYVPRPADSLSGKNSGPSSSSGEQNHQIFCCAFNASGTVFVTGSSDNLARVWNACKPSTDDSGQPNYETDVLSGHENDVNYVQFSGCAVSSRFSTADAPKDEIVPKFRNSWFSHDNIVTCSRDGSAIIWVPRSRRSHGKTGRWVRHYHLKVPPPPMPPLPPRGGPRQRILPTPRGVNMIVWSLDNRFVLAAIMDCRICVWNAADGSLVHCLTGHTESTYVLDVHPFNPRIAMSAGYDGRTILWDIWEGKPIRTYEISRFKLVDGKFSPDGSSIILSDDVGQLYILSTGQGESKRDAKYDQFFLGDYRPLIQDTNGNVLDQETQLQPYKRNLVDLLCDSGMIPFTEPYQTMYQKRRLGALNIEWRPSSLKFAIGPDISLDRDYQMLPLSDLDMIVDPLPEFVDAMEWEPEIEVLSDGNDSEYNVTEEYSMGEEQGSLLSSDDSECSEEDSEMEGTHKDGLRRSKRKTHKSEVEIMTSSGRRVKRKILDEFDANSFGHDRSKKSRNRKALQKKSSKSKSSRPQRAAARNALTLFSKIGTSSEAEDEDESESDSSDIESMTQDLNTESDESSRLLQVEQMKHSKGKEVSLDEGENAARIIGGAEPHHVGNRTKLVLRLPGRGLNKLPSWETVVKEKGEKQDRFAASSSRVYEEAINGFQKAGKSLDLPIPFGSSEACVGEGRRGQSSKTENCIDLSDKYRDVSIKWGGVRARTSKRLRSAEAVPSDLVSSSKLIDENKEKQNACNGYLNHEKDCVSTAPCSDMQPVEDGKMDEASGIVGIDIPDILDGLAHGKDQNHPCLTKSIDIHESLLMHSISAQNALLPAVYPGDGVNNSPETNTSTNPILMKSEMTLKTFTKGPETSELKTESSERNHMNGSCGDNSYMNTECSPISKVSVHDGFNGTSLQNQHDVLPRSEAQVGDFSRPSLCESGGLNSHPKRMFDFVYRRTKSNKEKVSLECEAGTREGTAGDAGTSAAADLHEPPSDVSCRTRSNRLRFTLSLHSQDDHDNGHIGSVNGWQLQGEDAGSSSRVAHGMRSARNRRNNYYFHDSSPIRKSHQSVRKASWLMLTTHEEGFRYIPQQGDEIAYLRQGHQEYLDHTNINEAGPWRSLKGRTVRAVEFCKVVGLEYSTFPGSGESCCKLTLQFSDPSSNVLNLSFKLTLPEVTGFPDFIVERTRFEASINRNWSCRDKCKVWWKNEGEDDGSWWDGRVIAVKPKSHEFPDSPWERYAIQYRSDPKEPHLHSPWELFDADTQWDEPHISDESKDKLLAALSRLERSSEKVQDRFGVNKLNQVSDKSNFINRFPVPISLGVIRSRLECNYYRSLDAVKHDVNVMLLNADSYFAKNAELSTKMKRLSDWFSLTFSSVQAA